MYLLRLLSLAIAVSISFITFSNQAFEKNNGQFIEPSGSVNSDVLYCFEKNGFKVTLRKNGFSYEVSTILSSDLNNEIKKYGENTKVDVHHERVDFLFPKVPSEITKHDKSDVNLTYYKESEIIYADLYRRIVYHNVQNGIDIEFLISDGSFKYNIIKNEGANLQDFFLLIQTDAEIEPSSEHLKFNLLHRSINECIPYSYLPETNEEKKVHYVYEKGKVKFISSDPETDKKLIIDPEPDVVWSTFFGGNQYDFITDSSIGEGDTLYTVGITMSSNNIATSGAHQTTYQGDLDVSISKFHKNGDLIWSTYYAGPQSERSYAIFIDEKNELYVAGSTFSTIGFVTGGAHQSNLEGGDDLFIVKMSNSGIREWGTYHGGNAHDFVTDIHVENDTIYLVGHTTSSNIISSPGSHEESLTANEAGHITLFNTSGQFLWGTYFGSEQNNSVEGIAVSESLMFIAGRTSGTTGISTTGAFQENLAGFTNAFVSSFTKSGSQIWGTYFGGQYTDIAKDIVLDTSGGVFIAGDASSQNNIATPGAHQETRLSSEQGFISHFDAQGNQVWGTYTGGTGSDYVSLVNKDSIGSIYIGGKTSSIEDISTNDSYQANLSGAFDCFIQRFNFDGTLEWGSYLGGQGNEDVTSLELNASNNLIVTGSTNQNDTVFGIGNSNNDQYNGGALDGFIAYLCQTNIPDITYNNGELNSSAADMYEWYLDGQTLNLYSQSITPPADGVYTVETSSFGKCPTISDTFNYSSVSLNEENVNSISIYPNPTKSMLNVKSSTNSTVIVTDLTGRRILHSQGLKHTYFDLSGVKSGVYVVYIIDGDKNYKQSIIKL